MTIEIRKNGLIVLPASVRKALGIQDGERLELKLNLPQGRIELTRKSQSIANGLAGSLARYKTGKNIPSRKQIHAALNRGLGREKPSA